MSTLSQFGAGMRATKSVVNAFSSNGFTPITLTTFPGARILNSGALTANTLKSIFTATGAGVLSTLQAYTNNATSRTLRLRVIVDGVSIFDATSASVAAAAAGAYLGSGRNAGGVLNGQPITFLQSLDVQVASSLTETDGIGVEYILLGV